MNEGIGMPSPISLLLVCIVSVAASTGCTLQSDIAAGGGAEVCNSLAAVRSDVTSLPSKNSTETVADVRAHLAEIDRSLGAAREQSHGLARLLLANLENATTATAGSISDLSDESPVASLPRSIRAAHRELKNSFADVWAKLACT